LYPDGRVVDQNGYRMALGAGVALAHAVERQVAGRGVTCHALRDKNGTAIGFTCGRLGPPCSCGGVTDNLCDYPVGNRKTCDKRLCGHCSHEIGPDLHYCHAHHKAWREFRDGGGAVRELQNVEPFKGR
jgi:hypothetical protein